MSGPLADKQQKMGEHVENIKFSWVSKLNFQPFFVVYPLEGQMSEKFWAILAHSAAMLIKFKRNTLPECIQMAKRFHIKSFAKFRPKTVQTFSS